MEKKEDEWGLNVMLWLVLVWIGVAVIADVLGRAARLVAREWPNISWGMAILIGAFVAIWTYAKFRETLDDWLAEAKEAAAGIKGRLEYLEKQDQTAQQRIVDLTVEIRECRGDYREVAGKLDDLAELKSPVQASAAKAPEAVQNAMQEIVGGSA